jgi:hypothetical protein
MARRHLAQPRPLLGDVQAADEKAAVAAAVTEFNLDDERRRRLV